MPLTPFHWSAVVFGLVFFEIFYIPALVVSSVIVDTEPFYYMFVNPQPDGMLHGIEHTYLAATLVGIAAAWLLTKMRSKIDKLMAQLKLGQAKISSKQIYFSSVFAAYSHVFLDSLMHAYLRPFWPITDYNPFLGVININWIYAGTGLFLLLNALLYTVRLLKKR